MYALEDIQKRVQEGRLFQEGAFDGLELDAIMDRRDQPEFEQQWNKTADAVLPRWESMPPAEARRTEIDAVREYVFKRVFSITGGHDETAGAVCDDFELICKAAVVGTWTPFLEHMVSCYQRQQIPDSEIAEPDTSPNGGPAEPLGSSGVGGGPPSVS